MSLEISTTLENNPQVAKANSILENIQDKIERADEAVVTDGDRSLPELLGKRALDEATAIVKDSRVPGLQKSFKVFSKTLAKVEALEQSVDSKAAPTTAEDLRQHRLDKLARIRERGDEPFKYAFARSSMIAEARTAYTDAEQGATEDNPAEVPATLAGRMMAYREHGKSAFADLSDESGKIQIFFGQKQLGEEAFSTLRDLDIGDFVGVTGTVKRTKKDEITIFATQYEILTKSLQSLPEKHHGLKDAETRYRKRYLDMVANPEVLEIFKRRIAVIQLMREWLTTRGYLEVETPMFHAIPGGATARPFISHHNAFDQDFFLRVAPELFLKKLIVGGFDKVFEINRCFRNEGVDTRHNPEFTTMELYTAYKDYMELMDETEAMMTDIISEVVGGMSFPYQGRTIDITRPWKRMTLYESIREYAGIDLESTRDRDEAAKMAGEIGVEIDPSMGYGKIVDEVMSEKVQPHLVQPTFLYDYPIEISPLAKKKRGSDTLTERFQPFIGRLELGNAFSELNDPIDQRARFMDQLDQREAGDDEAQFLDEDFISALEVGMPPTAGLGIGLDRLAMLVTDSASIREVIMFPTLRTVG
jgi:lysyl-tRNA synthetase class 2